MLQHPAVLCASLQLCVSLQAVDAVEVRCERQPAACKPLHTARAHSATKYHRMLTGVGSHGTQMTEGLGAAKRFAVPRWDLRLPPSVHHLAAVTSRRFDAHDCQSPRRPGLQTCGYDTLVLYEGERVYLSSRCSLSRNLVWKDFNFNLIFRLALPKKNYVCRRT